MSEKKNESIADKKISRRSMLKWTGALAGAAAVGAGLGFEAAGLLQPTPMPSTTTTTTGATTPVAQEEEQVFLNGSGNMGGAPGGLWVYVKNGRIIRVRPVSTPPNKIQQTWRITAANRTYTPGPREGHPRVPHHTLTLRRRVYDPHRIKYPMKRVDWSSGNPNAQNRGKSKFVRISWDEALTTIASELKRVNDTYGPSGILQTYPSHMHPWFHLNESYRSVMNRTLCFAFGGHTGLVHSPDSWEGWVYGATWAWGYSWSWGLAPKSGIEDVMKNTKLIINWANDQLGQTADATFSVYQPYFKELGIKRIYITPDLNRSAIAYGDTWIPIFAGTDAALAAAIANVWITEGTYDKDYVATHSVGFDKWSDYITGKEDGVAKTPEWAEPRTGIKARVIRALAREWASKPTMVGMGNGTICRVPYGHEITRMVALLLAMQGIGKPGWGWTTLTSEPANPSAVHKKPQGLSSSEVWGNLNWVANKIPENTVHQMIWKNALPDAILKPPISWHGMGMTGANLPPKGVMPWWPHRISNDHGNNAQWSAAGVEVTYPVKGYSEVHAIMAGGSNLFGCWNHGAKLIQAYQNPKIEFVFRIDYWWAGDTILSDILLPACTVLERNDIAYSANFPAYLAKAIEPMWESKSDFEIEALLADKLGVLDKVHEGLDEDGWIERFFNSIAVSEYMSFQDFKNLKGAYPEGILPTYFEYPWNPLNKPAPPPSRGLGTFADDPKNQANWLNTKSGLIEFESGYLKDWFPGDKIRQPVPHYWDSWEGLQAPLAKKYTLLVDSPHPTWRFHNQYDENKWLSEIPSAKVRINGYAYEALWMNPKDAAARGIQNGDLVRVFNDRGQALMGAYVNEKMMPGVVRAPDGGFYDPIEPGNPQSLDKGGCMNYLSPHQYQDGGPDFTTDMPGGAPSPTWSAYLVEVEKYTGPQPVPDSASEVRIKEGI
jgi:anaerobic selenocysteine-containing dehydrogenase